MVRGKPSRMQPFSQSLAWRRSRMMPSMMSSLTSCPASMIALAFLPSSVAFSAASRRMTPVEMCGTSSSAASFWACVPFPAPGGPNRMSLTMAVSLSAPSPDAAALHEAVVMPHDELAFDLLDGVHGDPNHDQERSPAEVERHSAAAGDPGREDGVEEGTDEGNRGHPTAREH